MMRVPIDVFDHLESIAERCGISQTKWAKACGIEQPRIAEFVSVSKEKKGLKPKSDRYTGTVTMQSMFVLINGLKKLIGEKRMKDELKKELHKESEPFVRLQLITLEKYNQGDKEFIRRLEEFASLLYHTESE